MEHGGGTRVDKAVEDSWLVDIPGLSYQDTARLIEEVSRWPGKLGPIAWDPRLSLIELFDARHCRFLLRVYDAAAVTWLLPGDRCLLEFALEACRACLLSFSDEDREQAGGASLVVKSDWMVMTLNPIDFDTAQRIVGLVGAWGYQARALATTRWGMSSDDRETVRRRVRLLSAALRSGRLSRADQQSVRADRTVLRSWLRRTWWPQVRYYQLATRLDVLFPEWAERVQREHRPAPEVEAAWFEGPDPVIDPLWRVIVPELRASDVARLQRVVDAWGGDRELMVDRRSA